MVERLLAHARICREIADTTLNRETARELEELAQDCIQAARDAELAPQFQRFPSQAAG
jgi:type II secretory pathway component PulJ